MATEFHDDELGRHIRHGYQALAIDEDRSSFRPKLWQRSPDWRGRLEQAWFSGAHGDVGGEVHLRPGARPLANIPLNWLLRHAVRLGLMLPEGWEARFPEDPAAPMLGTRVGIGKFFLLRSPRRVGGADGETIHLSIRERMARIPGYLPRGEMGTEADDGVESPAT
jgi:hypothetical protein